MKIVTSESSLLNETHTRLSLLKTSLSHCPGQDGKSQVHTQHSNEVGLAAKGRGKAYFCLFCFFSFYLDKVLLLSYM